MPSIGRLRKRGYFERLKKRVDDAGGGFAPTWLPVLTAWCQIIPQNGSERIAAGRLEAAALSTLRIRSSAEARTITEADRVIVDGLTYNIRGIDNPDSKNRFLEMLIEVGVAT